MTVTWILRIGSVIFHTVTYCCYQMHRCNSGSKPEMYAFWQTKKKKKNHKLALTLPFSDFTTVCLSVCQTKFSGVQMQFPIYYDIYVCFFAASTPTCILLLIFRLCLHLHFTKTTTFPPPLSLTTLEIFKVVAFMHKLKTLTQSPEWKHTHRLHISYYIALHQITVFS